DALAGVRAVAADRDSLVIVVLYGADSLVAGLLNVLIVVTALRVLDLGQSGVGTLTAAVGLGGVVGGGVMIARLRASRHGDDLVLLGLPVAGLSFVSSEAAALALLAVVGLGVTVVDVAAVTLLQRNARGEILPHALGLLQTVFVAGVGIGTLLAPVLVAALGVPHPLLLTAAILPLLAGALGRRLRRLDDRPAVDPGRFALLAAIPIFRPLPEASLDVLARSLGPVDVGAGDVLFEQGDEGDAFYVVQDGEAEIWQDGVLVNEHGPGGYFGEIALLR